jgi:hypothetical protein
VSVVEAVVVVEEEEEDDDGGVCVVLVLFYLAYWLLVVCSQGRREGMPQSCNVAIKLLVWQKFLRSH